MPVYVYLCEANGLQVEVRHGIEQQLGTWGEVCFAAQIPMGETDFLSPVRKVLTPPAIAIPTSDSELRSKGFTKLVKRDDGVYENVTRIGDEARYMRKGDTTTLPQFDKRIGD